MYFIHVDINPEVKCQCYSESYYCGTVGKRASIDIGLGQSSAQISMLEIRLFWKKERIVPVYNPAVRITVVGGADNGYRCRHAWLPTRVAENGA